MKVVLVNGDVEVHVEAPGEYAPEVMRDLIARAVEAYRQAFEWADVAEDEQQ